MVGLGEKKDEIFETMRDLRDHGVEMITIGQYLQPSKSHLAVQRYVHPNEFLEYSKYAKRIGFKSDACGPLVRSSYHAEKQIFETAI
jgi:lipoic acid synthetase